MKIKVPKILEPFADIYTEDYIKSICSKLDVTKQDIIDSFRAELIYYGFRYQHLIDKNSNLLTKDQQKKKFQALDKALTSLSSKLSKVQDNVSLEMKFGQSMMQLVGDNKNDETQELLSPIFSSNSYNLDKLQSFISLLTTGIRNARFISYGKEKTSIKTQVLKFWVSSIRIIWPAKNFTLGKYYKESGEYHSQTLEVLTDLIKQIDSNITSQNVASAVKTADPDPYKNLEV